MRFHCHTASGRRSRGFTLIELLVVIGVIMLLAGILMPVLDSAREKARQAYCMSNMRNIGLAITMYCEDEGGLFPEVHGDDYENPVSPRCEWWELLEEYGLKRRYMLCKSDKHMDDEDVESYIYNGFFAFNKRRAIVDDPVSRIIVSERGDNDAALTHQGYPAWKALSVWEEHIAPNRHGKTSNYLFVDGHVAGMKFEDTIGEAETDATSSDYHCNESNMHYVPEFEAPEPDTGVEESED